MSSSAVVKAPDTAGIVWVTVTEPSTDFTLAQSVTLLLEARDGSMVTKPATISAASSGTLTVWWTNDGSLAADVYRAWAKITWSGGTTQTAPTAGSLSLTVEAVG